MKLVLPRLPNCGCVDIETGAWLVATLEILIQPLLCCLHCALVVTLILTHYFYHDDLGDNYFLNRTRYLKDNYISLGIAAWSWVVLIDITSVILAIILLFGMQNKEPSLLHIWVNGKFVLTFLPLPSLITLIIIEEPIVLLVSFGIFFALFLFYVIVVYSWAYELREILESDEIANMYRLPMKK